MPAVCFGLKNNIIYKVNLENFKITSPRIILNKNTCLLTNYLSCEKI